MLTATTDGYARAGLAADARTEFLGIAQSGRSKVAESFKPQTNIVDFDLAAGLMILLIAAGLCYVLWRAFRRKEDEAESSVRAGDLFFTLVELHQLTSAEQKAMKRMAVDANISRPAVLFVRPDLFRQIRKKEEQTKNVRPAVLDALEEKLFGGADD